MGQQDFSDAHQKENQQFQTFLGYFGPLIILFYKFLVKNVPMKSMRRNKNQMIFVKQGIININCVQPLN